MMIDNIFGELIYNGGWTKTEKINLWEKEINVGIFISAYENEAPNEAQQNSYKSFKSNIDKISEKTLKELKQYISSIENDIKAYCNIDSLPDNIFEVITVDKIFFSETGSFAIMCIADWDSHGLAVLCKEDNITVGPQDIVWLEN